MSGEQQFVSNIQDRINYLKDGRIYDVFTIGSNVLCRVEMDEDVISYKLIDVKDSSILATYPITSFFEEDALDTRLFMHHAMLKQDQAKLALAMYEYNRIIVLDLVEGRHFSIEAGETESGKYGTGAVSNQRIYAIFKPMCGNDVIRVFDWEGHFLKELTSSMKLQCITVDDADFHLYALSAEG